MTSLNGYLLIVAALLIGYLYVIITKADVHIHDHQRSALALDAGQISSFVSGTLIYLVFPFEFSTVGVINIWLGAFIGMLFCWKNESKLISGGLFFGGLASVMGTMVGALAVNPAICGLPITKLPIQNPDAVIGFLSVIILFVTGLLANYLLKNV